MNLQELIEFMRREGDTLAASGATGHATLARRYADLVQRAYDELLAEEIGIPEAAAISGYAAETLRQLVREGKLRATKRNSRLYVRRADLPRKPPKSDVEVLAAEINDQQNTPPTDVERIAAKLAGSRIPE